MKNPDLRPSWAYRETGLTLLIKMVNDPEIYLYIDKRTCYLTCGLKGNWEDGQEAAGRQEQTKDSVGNHFYS